MPTNPGKCARCNHPWSLHGNGTTQCKAVGCKGGENGPCPEFQAEAAEPVPR